MCSLKFQKMILNIFDRAIRHFLWDKEEDTSTPRSLVTWSMVCNLEFQNKAVLLKKLNQFYMKAYVPWVRLVWCLYGDNVCGTPGIRVRQISDLRLT
jgi:hypothetical protein